jgi:hypothetical protein
MGQLALCAPVTSADRGVGLRRGRTPPPTTRPSAASSGAARRWTGGASTSWPGCPRVTRPWRSGVADVCLDAGTAVLLARPARALVAVGPAGHRGAGRRGPARARQAGADPVTGQPAAAAALSARLLDHVRPALRDHGDTETITSLLRRLDDQRTGADRQRALFASAASAPAFITALAARRCPATSRAAGVGPMPGQRQARSRGSEEEQHRILRPHLEHWQPGAGVPCQ